MKKTISETAHATGFSELQIWQLVVNLFIPFASRKGEILVDDADIEAWELKYPDVANAMRGVFDHNAIARLLGISVSYELESNSACLRVKRAIIEKPEHLRQVSFLR